MVRLDRELLSVYEQTLREAAAALGGDPKLVVGENRSFLQFVLSQPGVMACRRTQPKRRGDICRSFRRSSKVQSKSSTRPGPVKGMRSEPTCWRGCTISRLREEVAKMTALARNSRSADSPNGSSGSSTDKFHRSAAAGAEVALFADRVDVSEELTRLRPP